MRYRILLLALSAVLAAGAPTMTTAAPLTWPALQSLPLPAAGAKHSYGPAPEQFGELRLPKGKPPKAGWPVAVLVHGGCWLNQFDYRYFTHLAAALTEHGVATWTLEYRRIGDTDGGWPGSFLDVAQGTDHLALLAKRERLDVQRVVSAGHSAGGHLALWLAARQKLPKTSALAAQLPPLRLQGVVGLAAITDLHSYRIGAPGSCNSAVDQLMGGTPEQHPLRYAQASPLALLPLGLPQWLVAGALDPIVPLAGQSAYAQAARAAGDQVAVITEPDAGHFDLAAPTTAAGAAAVTAILQALGQEAPR